jgi:hypothetical protein
VASLRKSGFFVLTLGALFAAVVALSTPQKVRKRKIAGFGNMDEWQAFNHRNAKFLERFTNLKNALAIAFARSDESVEPADRMIFYLGRLCVEDFNEILVLAGNGYGIGAFKLLRGMYERSVTAHHLHEHPESIDDFLEYYWVAQHKEVKAIIENFGAGVLDADLVQEVETNFTRVKSKFMVTDCATCGTTRLNHTWSKLDVVSMAKAGKVFGKFVVDAYYLPLRHGHSTVGAVSSRLVEADGGTGFYGGPQRREADGSLKIAHKLIVLNLALQFDHFQLQALDNPLKQCLNDVKYAWGE